MKKISLFLLVLAVSSGFSQKNKVLSVAHRGASGTAPENTIAAFQKAIEQKADFLELDIHLSKDSIPVVIHDKSVDRTTDGTGKIREMTMDEIKKCDAGIKTGKQFTGEKIPTLEEVIKLVNGQAILLIEIKKGGNFYPGIEKFTVGLIEKYNARQWCYVQSNNKKILMKIKELDPSVIIIKSMLGKIPLLPVYIDNELNSPGILEFPGAGGFTIHHRFFSKRTVKKIHARNKLVFAWTVNNERRIRKVIGKGVDGIITNFPDRIPAL